MHWIDWMIVGIPILVILRIAVVTRRQMHGVSDFMAAGRSSGRYLVQQASDAVKEMMTMSMARRVVRLACLAILAACVCDLYAGVQVPVTLETLLDEMTDRDALARWPQAEYRLLQASSYDRKQTSPTNLATWFANNDSKQFIRVETNATRREWVMMEHTGPGAVVRFWTPLLGAMDKAIIRFYFDGDTTPGIAVHFNQLFRGQGFAKPPFAFIATDEKVTAGVGGDLYLPIPFARSCKITLDETPFYYVINYRAYDSGTEVKTFTLADDEAAGAAVRRAAEALEVLGGADVGGERRSEGQIAPGEDLVLDLPPGSRAVRTLRLDVEPREDQMLRSVVLAAAFDGESSVWCPIGEFFGCGTRWNPVWDWCRGVDTNGTLTSRWVMPYQKTGRLSLKNVGKKPVTAVLTVSTAPWNWDERSMHFHAGWHQESLQSPVDWNYVELAGQGVYVGDTLTVHNPTWYWNGEGDERVYVDGETFPSHLGTGMEDYYGYAWGMAHWFSSPFIAMPKRDMTTDQRWGRPDWSGYTTTSRVRLLDGIPYRTSLKVDMELLGPSVTQAVGAFWYTRPGGTGNRGPEPAEAARDLLPWNGPLNPDLLKKP